MIWGLYFKIVSSQKAQFDNSVPGIFRNLVCNDNIQNISVHEISLDLVQDCIWQDFLSSEPNLPWKYHTIFFLLCSDPSYLWWWRLFLHFLTPKGGCGDCCPSLSPLSYATAQIIEKWRLFYPELLCHLWLKKNYFACSPFTHLSEVEQQYQVNR